MSRRRFSRLHLEPLERRDLLALWDGAVGYGGPDDAPRPGGDITAELIDGTLFVRGDDADNGLMIEGSGQNLYVRTVNDWSTINGRSARINLLPLGECTEPVPAFSGVTRIVIEMGAGEDLVWLHGRDLPRTSVDTGDGADAVNLGGWTGNRFGCGSLMTTGALSVPMPTTFVGDLLIDMGAGNDRFSPHAVVNGTALIRLGAGDDRYEPPHYEDRFTHTGPLDGDLIATTKVIDLEPDEGPQPGPSPETAAESLPQPPAESTPPPPDDTPLEPTHAVLYPTYAVPHPIPVQTVLPRFPLVLSSQVTAEVVSGTLFIRGGDEGDWVRVIQRGEGKFAVTSGRAIAGGGFFSVIEGCGDNAPIYEGVTAIVIELGAGDDSVHVNGNLPGLSIDTGDGDDTIRLGGWTSDFWNQCTVFGIPSAVAATIGGDLTIDAGAGNDVLYPHALVQGDADIRLGSGDDALIEQNPIHGGGEATAPLTVEGEETIDFGADEGDPPSLPPPPHDVTAEVVDGTLYLRGGDRADWVRIESRGNQSFAVRASRLQPHGLHIVGLGGSDDSTVYENVTAIVVELGAGDDSVHVFGGAPRLSIDTGDGDDQIRLGGSSHDGYSGGMILHSIPFPVAATIRGDLAIDMGAGHDVLRPHARVQGDAVIRMGAGDDEIIETTPNYFGESPAPLTVEGNQLIDFGADEGEPLPPPERPAYTVARPDEPATTIMSAKGRVPEVPTMAGTLIPAPLIGPLTLSAEDLIEVGQHPAILSLEAILPYLVVPTHARRALSPDWHPLPDDDSDWPQ